MKIENNKLILSADEVENIVYEDSEDVTIIETINGSKLRWQTITTVIVEYNYKFYELYYLQANTEGQENSFESQECPEVEKKEILAYEWRRK